MDTSSVDINNKQPETEDSVARPPMSPEQRQRKKKMMRKILFVCLGLIPLFVWVQSLLFKIEVSVPVNSNILIFALINANVLLVLLVFFLVLRYLAELLFERYQKVLGTKLKTKLVVSFISLSLIPTILLFFVALRFISTSMDYWFNTSIEKSLQESLKLAQSILHDTKDQVNLMSEGISIRLSSLELASYDSETINRTLENILAFNPINGPDSITLITDDKNVEITVVSPKLRGMKLPRIPLETLQQTRGMHESQTIIQESEKGDLVCSVRAVVIGNNQINKAVLVTSLLIKEETLSQMTAISQGIEGYKQLKYLKEPFKFWMLIVLLIVTLLMIFSAIWFGFYISKGITEPVDKLALATRRIAEGDLEFFIESSSDDELGMLVDSFNQMTMNLSTSNKKLAETYKALHASSQESEQRRRYTEIILQNVSAGVISLDNHGRITTINHFAEKFLNIDQEDYISKRYQDTLLPDQTRIIDGFIDELNITGKTTIEQHLRLSVMQKNYSLLINFTRLEDEDRNSVGYVLVFDNLTKLEKMQRMAAWREVARRIAHEIKNPLTPIQLSAQRLRRRYPEILAEKDSIFDQCTATIIDQVDELKRLVSEFSQFARMPKVHKAPADLARLAEQTLVLFKAAHKHIIFSCRELSPVPVFSFDAEQIKRCIINLIDNAVAVLPDGGTIDIELSLDENKESVFIKVYDNGPGTSKDDKLKLFEPYFSTKKTGTGLGLAIVSTIVSDHNGYIRVQDNIPHGSVFIIELPLSPGDTSET
jgi:two-component system, NtrC family, nitrogen regulation sensor histidine kinase NtrY